MQRARSSVPMSSSWLKTAGLFGMASPQVAVGRTSRSRRSFASSSQHAEARAPASTSSSSTPIPLHAFCLQVLLPTKQCHGSRIAIFMAIRTESWSRRSPFQDACVKGEAFPPVLFFWMIEWLDFFEHRGGSCCDPELYVVVLRISGKTETNILTETTWYELAVWAYLTLIFILIFNTTITINTILILPGWNLSGSPSPSTHLDGSASPFTSCE